MPEALRLKGFKPGTIAASRQGRDRGTVYLVISINDPFCECSDGKRRPWPERMKKKRLKHLIAIDELSPGDMTEFSEISDPGHKNKWIREKLRNKEG